MSLYITSKFPKEKRETYKWVQRRLNKFSVELRHLRAWCLTGILVLLNSIQQGWHVINLSWQVSTTNVHIKHWPTKTVEERFIIPCIEQTELNKTLTSYQIHGCCSLAEAETQNVPKGIPELCRVSFLVVWSKMIPPSSDYICRSPERVYVISNTMSHFHQLRMC